MAQEKIETITMSRIYTENDVHELLKVAGYHTNYAKKLFENGEDIIAVKDGIAFKIEHKRLEKREDGTYRFTGGILGDICILSTPNGNPIFVLNDKTSLTKTARFIDSIF